jgi:hypothetical protein
MGRSLERLIRPQRPDVEGQLPEQPVRAVVESPPVDLASPLTVIVPSFHQHRPFEITRWMPRGDLLPVKGDEALLVFDETQRAWMAAWWPSS